LVGPIAKFALPSDNVNMLKIVGTSTGRIFLGGNDGSLNEVQYQAEDGWFTRKCRKLNYSGMLSGLTFQFNK
jgi:nuclear pore complex protein Nup155